MGTTECQTCHAIISREAAQLHDDWHWGIEEELLRLRRSTEPVNP